MMEAGRIIRTCGAVSLAVLVLSTAGCSRDMDDLLSYIDAVKARPGGRIEPLPQIKPYETFTYQGEGYRSPFVPSRRETVGRSSGPRPIANRNKEYLEQFPLDTLTMVGSLKMDGKTYGLVQTQEGIVHRVLPGNFLGQNNGRIVAINDSRILIEELVPDGVGGFFKRSAGIGLSD